MAEAPPQPTERLSALQFISNTHRSLHDQRRKSETQAFFTALTFYALIGAARFTSVGTIPSPLPGMWNCAVWILVMAMAVISAVYLYVIHRANQVNKTIAETAESEIQRIIQINATNLDKRPTRRKVAPTCVCQIIIIFIFAFASAALLTSSAFRPVPSDQCFRNPGYTPANDERQHSRR